MNLKEQYQGADTTQKMKFSIKDFFSKCDQIRKNLRIWPHLLKKSLMEDFIFCAVWYFVCYLLCLWQLTVLPHKKNLLLNTFMKEKYFAFFLSWNKLREKCPNTECFLVRIFLYSIRIQENRDQKKLQIWTLFTQRQHCYYDVN